MNNIFQSADQQQMTFNFWSWSALWPDYESRMHWMNHPFYVESAFIDASYLTLEPMK